MLISHKHRFIFIRTRKVASSSLEVCLSKILDATDFATHQSDRDRLKNDDIPRFDTRIFRGFDKFGRPLIMNGHSPLTSAYRMFGRQIQDYMVVSADRNPWDRAVSIFYWSNRKTDMKSRRVEDQIKAFRDYAAKHGPDNWVRRWFGLQTHRAFSQKALYSLDGTSIVDFMLRYECLAEDLETLSQKLSLSTPLSLSGISAKTGHRAKSSRRFQSYYDEASKNLVAEICNWEIEHFGYDFESKNTPHYLPDPDRFEVKEKYLTKVSKTRA